MSGSLVAMAVCFVSLIIFFALNFSLVKPQEYCYGSDTCVQNCFPSNSTITFMCCEEHCVVNPGTAVCIQNFAYANGKTGTCTCYEATACTYSFDQKFSNLAWFFMLISVMMIYTTINLWTTSSTPLHSTTQP